jgi:hypothetical protein
MEGLSILSLSKDARRGRPIMLQQAQHDKASKKKQIRNHVIARNEAIANNACLPCMVCDCFVPRNDISIKY